MAFAVGLDARNGGRILNAMDTKQNKKGKKPITLEHFALAIQKDYAELRKDMATGFVENREEMKEGVRQLRAEMGIDFRNLDADMKMTNDAMVSKADLASTLAEELDKSRNGAPD